MCVCAMCVRVRVSVCEWGNVSVKVRLPLCVSVIVSEELRACVSMCVGGSACLTVFVCVCV